MGVNNLPVFTGEHSYVGEGWVFHGRPGQTSFKYPIFNLVVPIHSELAVNSLSSGRYLSLKATDYLDGQSGDLFQNFKQFMLNQLGYEVEHVWLQTLPRIFGYTFNPVSFWYCYRAGCLDAILCEVNNTFGDRHFYFMRPIGDSEEHRFNLPKRFHVSPFFPISGRYEFEFKLRDSSSDVRIRLLEGSDLKLDTRIFLNVKKIESNSKWRLFWRYGWMTPLVVIRIHRQALKLWLNKVSFHSRPKPPKEKLTL